MKISAVVAILMLTFTTQAQHQDQRSPDQQHAAMMHRGDQGMGFSQEKTMHRFTLLKHGGEIQATVMDANHSDNLEHIRMHLSHAAKMFSAGDFDIPMFVHGTIPPGVPVMKKLHAFIQYEYREVENGGKITIATTNPKALAAIHKFLRFQTSEHQTGDSTDVVQ